LHRFVAKDLDGIFKATEKFIDFTMAHLPEPPAVRPLEGFRLDWARMAEHLELVYAWRSRDLHDGTPIPVPMCQPPHQVDGQPAPIEVPLVLATWTGSATGPRPTSRCCCTPSRTSPAAHCSTGWRPRPPPRRLGRPSPHDRPPGSGSAIPAGRPIQPMAAARARRRATSRPTPTPVAEVTELLDIAPRRRHQPLVVQAQNRVDEAVEAPRSCLT